MVDTIIYIDSFEQKFVILKGLLQSELPKQHMVVIGVDQSLSNRALYKHRCLENIRIYTNWLENVMINLRTRQFLKMSWYPLLKDLLTTVQCHMVHLCP